MALHGTCWKHHDGVIEDAANWELKKEQNRTHNPLAVSCRDHRRCKEYDINMICPLNVKKCRCRPLVGMRWNPAEAECQVYVEGPQKGVAFCICPKGFTGDPQVNCCKHF